MSRRDTRRKIATGIFMDETQYYGIVNVRGAGFREKRFPLAESLEAVEKWRNDARIKLLGIAKRGTLPGTFARDAKRYLSDFTQHLASHDSRKGEIKPWVTLFAERPRGTITTADIARARTAWLADGKKPKTVNNRVNALRHLYHCLDGKKQWTPCDDLRALDVHRTPIQFVSDAVIAAVDLKLQELERAHKVLSSKTRARFRVLVSTGRRPSEVMRTQPTDLDLKRRIWLPRDGKGGFSPGIYLNDDMLAAWQLFVDVNAWGQYDTNLQAKRLKLAGWPADVKPYNARHTVGITLSERGIDLDDVGSMMGHRRRETTRKHYVPVLNSRMQKASEALEGRFQGWPSMQNTEPAVQNKVQNGKRKIGGFRPKTVEVKATNTAQKKPRARRIAQGKRKK